MSANYSSITRKWVALGLLMLLIFLIYSNTFNAAWHLDDFPNITLNAKLHLDELSHNAILGSFFANPQLHKYKDLYRPVACLTFALNWYVGQENVAGYHLVNITVHLLTAFILYLTVLALFDTPKLKNREPGSKHLIALLAATLWAVNPVQTQAVTYIVQRMASMAAMFYLLGIYCYIKARLNNSPPFRGLLFAASIISYLLALGSKENAAVLPLALILVEITFFQNVNLPSLNRRVFWMAAGGAVFVFLTGALFYLKGDFFSFIKGYGARPFTLGERLLTEPRILLFYLSQIFFPLPHRLSIAHDVSLSTSLVNPLTTLPSILLVFFLIGLATYRLEKWPLFSFAVLFFFLNHLIESTVVPLELVFEHRSYLPSVFLFLPVAAGVSNLFDYAAKRSPIVKAVMASIAILTIVAMGIGTYRRNLVWASEKSLWENALKKAPGTARPYLVLAGEYEKRGEFEKALSYYQTSLSLPDQRPRQSRGSAYNNMGTIYLQTHDYAEARKLYQKALKVRPEHTRYLHNLVLALVKTQNWGEASRKADLLISKDTSNSSYYNLKSYILLKQNHPQKAIVYLSRALKLAPRDRNSTVNLGVALSLINKPKEAEMILRRIHGNQPADIIILMCLIENSLRAKDGPGFDRYADNLMASFSAGEIREFLQGLDEGQIDVPLASKLLAPAIAAKLKHKLKSTGKKSARSSTRDRFQTSLPEDA